MAVPVTVKQLQQNKLLVQKPLSSVQAPSPPATQQHSHLYHKLVTPTELWEKMLWHTIQPHQELDQLATDLTRGIPIILSTDATMNATKRSCFVWTIHSTTDLWKGSGAIPGLYEDAHSTRSEAYSILTML